MNFINETTPEIPGNDLNLYFELGNNASANGKLEDSLKWFYKGLSKAKELKDELKEREFSTLILFSL